MIKGSTSILAEELPWVILSNVLTQKHVQCTLYKKKWRVWNYQFIRYSVTSCPSKVAKQISIFSKSKSFQSRFNLSLCNSRDGFSRVSAFIWNPMHLTGKQKKHEIWLNSFSPQILMAHHLSWVAAHQCLKGRGPIPIQSLTLQIMGWLIDQLLCVYF